MILRFNEDILELFDMGQNINGKYEYRIKWNDKFISGIKMWYNISHELDDWYQICIEKDDEIIYKTIVQNEITIHDMVDIYCVIKRNWNYWIYETYKDYQLYQEKKLIK